MEAMADVQGLYLVTAIVLAGLVVWVAWVLSRAPTAVDESQPPATRTPSIADPPRASEPSPVAPRGGPEAVSTDREGDASARVHLSVGSSRRAPMKTILGLASTSAPPAPIQVSPVVALPPKSSLDSHLEIQDSPASSSVVVTADADAQSERGPSNSLAVAVGRSDPEVGRSPEPHFLDTRQHLFIFADGSGKKVGTRLAGTIVVDEVVEAFAKDEATGLTDDPKLSPNANRLRRAVLAANRVLLQQARTAGYAGLGATVFAAHFSPSNDEVIMARVGPHRAYRVRVGAMTRLLSSQEGRLVGVSEKVDVEVLTDQAFPTDLYLFCSEEVGRALEEGELLAVLNNEPSVEKMTALLIAGVKIGGHEPEDTGDRVAIVVRVDSPPVSKKKEGRAKTVMGLG
jgi:serine/threonine protein phosphatase PrpC